MEWLKQFARLFGWKNRQYESLTEINAAGLRIRVWRTEATLNAALMPDNEGLIKVATAAAENGAGAVALGLSRLERIACVAIVDEAGNGVSFYPDWH